MSFKLNLKNIFKKTLLTLSLIFCMCMLCSCDTSMNKDNAFKLLNKGNNWDSLVKKYGSYAVTMITDRGEDPYIYVDKDGIVYSYDANEHEFIINGDDWYYYVEDDSLFKIIENNSEELLKEWIINPVYGSGTGETVINVSNEEDGIIKIDTVYDALHDGEENPNADITITVDSETYEIKKVEDHTTNTTYIAYYGDVLLNETIKMQSGIIDLMHSIASEYETDEIAIELIYDPMTNEEIIVRDTMIRGENIYPTYKGEFFDGEFYMDKECTIPYSGEIEQKIGRLVLYAQVESAIEEE